MKREVKKCSEYANSFLFEPHRIEKSNEIASRKKR